MVHSLPGLENAVVVRPAYAVEYDCLPATQFTHALMSKDVQGFFAAGQILGTSGYEEAAAQGLIAGINAALYVKGQDSFTLSRVSSYTGTLIDDLVTKELKEPYRMMTSRSEYRLLLRQDNADLRLTPLGREIGVVDDERWEVFNRKQEEINSERERFRKTRVYPNAQWDEVLAEHEEQLKQPATLEEILRRPRVPYSTIVKVCPSESIPDFRYHLELETEVKYEGYIERQKAHVANAEKLDNVAMPSDLNYLEMENLSKESREKLQKLRPETLGQASRIGGVSPADVSVLLVWIESRRRSERYKQTALTGI
jgi:tRNA uridine 5-carboxymethylaminomethyl modification enzyme